MCTRQKLCQNKNCVPCFNKSFASHPKSKFWSNTNNLLPRNVFKSSNKNFLFDCICGHHFDKRLCSITNGNNWCPYCCNPPQKLCDNNGCKQCYNKSFASHYKSLFWSKQNKIQPRQVFKFSHNKYKFECKCGHIFDSALNNINENKWCPYCSNQKLCINMKCKRCFKKSFASHPKAKFWSIKNNKRPTEVLKFSNKRYEFKCECGHFFNSVLHSISTNFWCPYCANQKLCDNEKCQKCHKNHS